MKKIIVFLVAILIAGLVIMPACGKHEDTSWSQPLPSKDLSELSLTEIWQAAVKGSGVEERTARLDYVTLIIEPDNQIFLNLLFEGRDSKGHPRSYNAGLAYNGDITGYSYETQGISADHHPMEIFSELDKIGLQKMAEMEMGEYSISMSVKFTWGGLLFDSKYIDLYELRDGLLVPLKEVTFHTQTSVAEICFFQEGVVSQMGSQLWLLPQDLARAESVEYLDTLTQN